MSTIVRSILFSILLLGFTTGASCKKNKNEGTVPDTYVNIHMSTSDPNFTALNSVSGWVYITGGVRGIIVFRKSSTEVAAYDRNCTYNSSDPCARVYVDGSGLMAKDTCCKSTFLLTDGTVVDPPATLPLKQYKTTFDGTDIYISN